MTIFLWIDFRKVRMRIRTRKVSCTKCKKYKEPKQPEIWYICDKKLLLSSIRDNCKSENEKTFKEEESIEELKILGWINNMKKYQMVEENISQEFRWKNIEQVKSYFSKEIYQNKLMCKKHKKVCRLLNYIEDLLILASAIIGCVSISGFDSVIGIPKDITSFALNICAITAEI